MRPSIPAFTPTAPIASSSFRARRGPSPSSPERHSSESRPNARPSIGRGVAIAARVLAVALVTPGCDGEVAGGPLHQHEPTGLPLSAAARVLAVTAPPRPLRATHPLSDETGPSGKVRINAGATATNSLEVTLDMEPSSAQPIDAFCARAEPSPPPLASDDCWRPLADPRARLEPGDGYKSLFVWWRDERGAVSAAPATDGILLDQTPPRLVELELEGRPLFTRDPKLRLVCRGSDPGGVEASGLEGVELSEDERGWSDPIPCPSVITHALSPGDGPRVVAARAVDGAGNRSTTSRATVTLDTEGPTGGRVAFAVRSTSRAAETLTVAAADASSGVQHVCLSLVGAGAGASAPPPADPTASGCVPYATQLPIDPRPGGEGEKRLTAYFFDAAGNRSAYPSVTNILYDATPPTTPSLVTIIAGHRSLRASWSPSHDGSSGIAGYELAVRELPPAAAALGTIGSAEETDAPWRARSGFSFGAPVAGTAASLELPNGHAVELVVRARDRAGNPSPPSEPVRASPRWPWTSEHRAPAGTAFYDARSFEADDGLRVVVAGAFGQMYVGAGAPELAWRRVDPMTDGHLLSLSRFEAQATWLLVTGEQGFIATSADLGLRWERRPVSESASALTITGAAVSVDLPAEASTGGGAAAPSSTALATTDSGEVLWATLRDGRWSSFTSGTQRAALWSLRAVDFCRGPSGPCRTPVALAVGDGPTAIRSTDLGLTWSSAQLPAGYAVPERLTSVAAAPDGSAIYAGVGETSPFRSGLLVSRDGGETWQEARGEHFLGVSVRALRFRSGTGELWLVGRKGASESLYRFDTAAGAVERSPSPSGIDRALYAVEPLGSGAEARGVLAVGQAGELVTSPDPRARALTRLNGAADGPLLDLAGIPGDLERLWAVGNGGYVARRRALPDGGARWEQTALGISADALRSVAIVATPRPEPAFGMAVGDHGVILELDGDAWRLHPDTGIVGESLQSVSCRAPGGGGSTVRCYAVGRSGTILQYDGAPYGDWLVKATGTASAYFSVDTWQDAAGLPRAVLVGAQGVYRTQRGSGNFGQEQRVEGVPTTLRGVRHKWNGDGHVMAVGSNSTVLLSSDSGERWTNVSPVGFPGVTFFDVASLNAGTGDEWLVVGSFGLVLKGRPLEDGSPSYSWTPLQLLTDSDVMSVFSAPLDTRHVWYATAVGQVLGTSSAGE